MCASPSRRRNPTLTLPSTNITVVLSNPDVHYYTFSLALAQVNSSFARRDTTYPVASTGRTVTATPASTPPLSLNPTHGLAFLSLPAHV
jgi:hypothetical protein